MLLTTRGRNERKKVNECIHNNTPLRITPEHENKKYEIWIEGDHEKNEYENEKRKKLALKKLEISYSSMILLFFFFFARALSIRKYISHHPSHLILPDRLLTLIPEPEFSLLASFLLALAFSRMRSDWELACCPLTSPLRFSSDHVHNFCCVYGHDLRLRYHRRRKSHSRHLRTRRMLGDGGKYSILSEEGVSLCSELP